MRVYASRSVLAVTGFMVLVSFSILAVFFLFFETISSRNQFIDATLGVFLVLIFASQAISLFNFWKKPTITIDHGSVCFQRFPFGLKTVPRNDLVSIEKKYLGVSQVLEITYKHQGKNRRALIAATVADQDKILSTLGLGI